MSSQRATSSAGNSGGEPALHPLPDNRSHYALLELSPQASAAELRQAFRNLSKRYHPDTTTLPQAEAREAFARLRQAYAVLADPGSRRAYDARVLQPPLVVVPPPPAGPAAAPRPIGVRRSLSGGEWFALVLLGLALALSLVLGVGLAWARGTALVTRPSWWSDAAVLPAGPSDGDRAALTKAGSDADGPERVRPARDVAELPAATAATPALPSMPLPATSASGPVTPAPSSGEPTRPGSIRQAP